MCFGDIGISAAWKIGPALFSKVSINILECCARSNLCMVLNSNITWQRRTYDTFVTYSLSILVERGKCDREIVGAIAGKRGRAKNLNRKKYSIERKGI